MIPSPTLGARLRDHGNNFGPVRLLAALVVVLAHSYPIAGFRTSVPLVHFLHNPYVGNYAVESFFVISGLLVTRSFLSGRQSLRRFVAARVLRLYPALICGVVLSVAVAVLCNANPAAMTLYDSQTWTYFWKNATAWEFVVGVPGAFPSNPLAGGPNGSLWSLPLELRMYVWVGILGALGALGHSRLGVLVLVATIIALIIATQPLPAWLWVEWQSLFAIDFMLGMLAYLLRDRLRLSFTIAAVVLAVYACAIAYCSADTAKVVFALCLPYWLLVLTCHPAIPIVRLPGDYSYGVYVYAFPLQQTIECLWPGISMTTMLATSLVLILCVAALSWHAMEEPLLRLKPPA
jgi:peptidoglycan/LPS O-acetylase OafA/YrhL